MNTRYNSRSANSGISSGDGLTNRKLPMTLSSLTTIGDYLNTYGSLIGEQAQSSLAPLHVPARDTPLNFSDLRRAPLPAQAHAITAIVKQLERDRACFFVGEQGVGKTICSIAAAHNLARHPRTGLVAPYRAIIMCPPHLTHKWEREIRKTISNSEVIQLRHVRQLMTLRSRTSPNHEPLRVERPDSFEWWIVRESSAKAGSSWRHAALTHRSGALQCPTCGQLITDKDGIPLSASLIAADPPGKLCDQLLTHDYVLADGNTRPGCGAPLFQYCRHDSGRAAWAISRYARTHLPRFFDIAIFDETHENRGRDSARAIAMSQLATASKRALALTGTFAGGYAWQIKTLLGRISPATLAAEGIAWEDETLFNERYGRIETKIITTSGGQGRSNVQSQGKSKTTRKSVKPGIMPTLFGNHMLDKCIFMGLSEMVDNLPLLTERVISCELDPQLRKEYDRIETTLREAIRQMLQRGDKRLLGAMLRVLLTYPDHPYGFDTIGYMDKGLSPDGIPVQQFIPVVTPKDLPADLPSGEPRPKEEALLAELAAQFVRGNQVWVYVQDTNKYDVQERLKELIESQEFAARYALSRPLRCGILRSNTVSTEDREDWIEEHGNKYDVMLSHPQLVQTGLDLFSPEWDERTGSGHNFSSIIFWQCGYEAFILRQAARRAWRIGQTKNCEVLYFYYNNTMQARAMALMGKKMATSNAIEGKFTDGGLSSLGDDSDSIEVELAKSLSEKFDDSVTQRSWTRISGNTKLVSSQSAVAEHSINETVKMKKRKTFKR